MAAGTSTTHIPPAELRDIYLPPFRAAVEAGSVSLMAAFNALNGLPSTANPTLLNDLLRGEWGFDGFVTSDWAGIQELLGHGVAADAPRPPARQSSPASTWT